MPPSNSNSSTPAMATRYELQRRMEPVLDGMVRVEGVLLSLRMDSSTRPFKDSGGSFCGTAYGNHSTVARSSCKRRVHFVHPARCARAASRSAGVMASSTYAPESSSNSSQVMKRSRINLPDLYYDWRSFIDYHI